MLSLPLLSPLRLRTPPPPCSSLTSGPPYSWVPRALPPLAPVRVRPQEEEDRGEGEDPS